MIQTLALISVPIVCILFALLIINLRKKQLEHNNWKKKAEEAAEKQIGNGELVNEELVRQCMIFPPVDLMDPPKMMSTMKYDNMISHKEYINMILEVESKTLKSDLTDDMIRILHGAIGTATESGELLDAIKKHLYYGKEFDKPNIVEEVGDIIWYCGLIMAVFGMTLEDAMFVNARKLRTRYPDKFTSEKALNRDLEKEREIFEND